MSDADQAFQNAVKNLQAAVAFMDKCKAESKYASEVGAWRDARDWIEEAAIKVARLAPVYEDAYG